MESISGGQSDAFCDHSVLLNIEHSVARNSLYGLFFWGFTCKLDVNHISVDILYYLMAILLSQQDWQLLFDTAYIRRDIFLPIFFPESDYKSADKHSYDGITKALCFGKTTRWRCRSAEEPEERRKMKRHVLKCFVRSDSET